MATDDANGLTDLGDAAYALAQLQSYLTGPYGHDDFDIGEKPEIAGAVAAVETGDKRLQHELDGAGFDVDVTDGRVVVYSYDAPVDFTQYTGGDDDDE